MLDVCEVKLNLRYPESRQEDITDAFMRGYTGAVEIGNKAIEKLKAENAELRELVLRLWECPVDDNKCTDCPHCKEHYDVCAGENHCKLYDHMRELGVEVE